MNRLSVPRLFGVCKSGYLKTGGTAILAFVLSACSQQLFEEDQFRDEVAQAVSALSQQSAGSPGDVVAVNSVPVANGMQEVQTIISADGDSDSLVYNDGSKTVGISRGALTNTLDTEKLLNDIINDPKIHVAVESAEIIFFKKSGGKPDEKFVLGLLLGCGISTGSGNVPLIVSFNEKFVVTKIGILGDPTLLTKLSDSLKFISGTEVNGIKYGMINTALGYFLVRLSDCKELVCFADTAHSYNLKDFKGISNTVVMWDISKDQVGVIDPSTGLTKFFNFLTGAETGSVFVNGVISSAPVASAEGTLLGASISKGKFGYSPAIMTIVAQVGAQKPMVKANSITNADFQSVISQMYDPEGSNFYIVDQDGNLHRAANDSNLTSLLLDAKFNVQLGDIQQALANFTNAPLDGSAVFGMSKAGNLLRVFIKIGTQVFEVLLQT